MTEPASTRLWTPDGFQPDEWTYAESAEALQGGGRIILPLSVGLDLSPQERAAARGRLGVRLNPPEPVEALEPALADVTLVALAFPAFSDGRSFSKAELLRTRLNFKGRLRAVGQVLVDQLPHMLRLGFDQFEVSDPVLTRRLEEGRTGGLPLAYQPAVQPGEELPARSEESYSWRRVPKR